jgi:hypothetical protein
MGKKSRRQRVEKPLSERHSRIARQKTQKKADPDAVPVDLIDPRSFRELDGYVRECLGGD